MLTVLARLRSGARRWPRTGCDEQNRGRRLLSWEYQHTNPLATACGCIVKDGLQAVKDGTFFLALSMPAFFALRIRTHYPWARDKKYWRLGIGGANKQTAAARKRERGIEKKAAAAKKKAA